MRLSKLGYFWFALRSFALVWPAEYGGGGLSAAQGRIIQQEFAKAGAYNPIGGMGVMMFGPTLLEYGTEELKRQHMPGIVTGTVRWCQGYSEPGSGSDLASLQTRAEDKGDHYIVNGQKTWTTLGQYGDWIFMLVRTDPNVKKQAGISFLLIDMTTPGVTVRPIQLIDGGHEVNEVFFENVEVPVENLVGEENKGWTYAKFLLGNERTGIARIGASKVALARAKAYAATTRTPRARAERMLITRVVIAVGLALHQQPDPARQAPQLGILPRDHVRQLLDRPGQIRDPLFQRLKLVHPGPFR